MKKLMMAGLVVAAMSIALIAEASGSSGRTTPDFTPFTLNNPTLDPDNPNPFGPTPDNPNPTPDNPNPDNPTPDNPNPPDAPSPRPYQHQGGEFELVSLGGGVRRVDVLVCNTKSGVVYKLMGDVNDAFKNPVEIARATAVDNNYLSFSGVCPKMYTAFKVWESGGGSDVDDSPNIDAQLRASPVIAPLSDGTPAFECVRDGDAVRVKVRIPKAMSGVTYELQGSPDVAFANPVKITSGSTNEAKGLELTGTVSETSCYFFRAVVEALKE